MATYNSLHNKVAIVTGAAQGIGEFIAREFAQNEANVVLTDVQKEIGTPRNFGRFKDRVEGNWIETLSNRGRHAPG